MFLSVLSPGPDSRGKTKIAGGGLPWVSPQRYGSVLPHPPFGMPPSERVRGLIGLVGVRFESPKGGKCSKKKHLVFEEVRSGSSYLFEVGLGCFFLVLFWWQPEIRRSLTSWGNGSSWNLPFFTTFFFPPSQVVGNGIFEPSTVLLEIIWNYIEKNTGCFFDESVWKLGWVRLDSFVASLPAIPFPMNISSFKIQGFSWVGVWGNQGGIKPWFPSSGVSP